MVLVMVWDYGTYEPGLVSAAIQRQLKFSLKGKKLLGSWALVRTHEDVSNY